MAPRVTLPAPLVQFSLSLPPSPAITGRSHHAVPYLLAKHTTRCRRERIADQHGIFCPSFSSYVNTIVAFAARHPQL